MKISTRILMAAGLLIACVPAAFVVTLLLFPLWGMIEARFGIEAVGHSGPADWCFWLVYAVLGSTGLAALLLRARKPARD
jgi:hypothetical protein